MSTQYSVVNKRIIEEVIQAECIRMIRETPVFADLQETKEDLIDKISDRTFFSVGEPEGTSIVIGTARAGCFSWRTENGFHDLDSVLLWLQSHPEFMISDEYGKIKTVEEFKQVLDWCRIYSSSQ